MRRTEGWRATHEVTYRGRRSRVMLIADASTGGGPAYSRSEWETCSSADVEKRGEGWFFLGHGVDRVRKIRRKISGIK